MTSTPEDDFHDMSEEAPRYTRSRSRNLRRRQTPPGGRSKGLSLLLGVVGVAAVLGVLFLLLRDGGQEDSQSVSDVETRISQLEQKLSRLETVEKRVAELETLLTKYRRAVNSADGSWKALEERLSRLSRELDTLRQTVASLKPSRGAQDGRTAPPAAAQDRKMQHEVLRGETLYGIARQYGISVEELRRLNGLPQDPLIHPGQKLIVPSR